MKNFKEKVINKVKNKTKPLFWILISAPLFLVGLSLMTLILNLVETKPIDNPAFYKTMGIMGAIGLVISFIIFIIKLTTNKFSLIKLDNKRLLKIYDEFEKELEKEENKKVLDNKREELIGYYERQKKMAPYQIIYSLVLLVACIIIAIILKQKLFRDVQTLYIYLILLISSIILIANGFIIIFNKSKNIALLSYQSLLIDMCIDIMCQENERLIKQQKTLRKKEKIKRLQTCSPLKFWFIQSLLILGIIYLSWLIAIGFEGEPIANTIVGFIIAVGIPIYFLIRNIYRRFKNNKKFKEKDDGK